MAAAEPPLALSPSRAGGAAALTRFRRGEVTRRASRAVGRDAGAEPGAVAPLGGAPAVGPSRPGRAVGGAAPPAAGSAAAAGGDGGGAGSLGTARPGRFPRRRGRGAAAESHPVRRSAPRSQHRGRGAHGFRPGGQVSVSQGRRCYRRQLHERAAEKCQRESRGIFCSPTR